ncbi:hypothetical protein A2U01_0086809, partial [Trifolium medium]|nr:hypothetical protein [Trifolium medium]
YGAASDALRWQNGSSPSGRPV